VLVDLDASLTQRQFGELIGVSQQAVSDLCSRGVLADGVAGRDWLLAYCDHMREMAAGRGGDDGANLVRERALLAREQRIRVALQNAEKKGELAPVAALENALATAGAKASKLLATIKGEIRRHYPQLGAAALASVDAIVGKALTAVATMSLEDADQDEDGDDSDTADSSEVEAA
jgi:phage terminase Nu1 subunit (DNA packaging protein)